MQFTTVFAAILTLAVGINAESTRIPRPTFNPRICPWPCPDGHVFQFPCGLAFIRDPCWDRPKPEKPKLCTRTCPDGFSWQEDCNIRYIQDPCVAGGHTLPLPKPTGTKPPVEEGEGKCARKCEDGTVLVEGCGVVYIQDPCAAGGHGQTKEEPKPQ